MIVRSEGIKKVSYHSVVTQQYNGVPAVVSLTLKLIKTTVETDGQDGKSIRTETKETVAKFNYDVVDGELHERTD